MLVELRELSLNDGLDVYDMIIEVGPGENGFCNSNYNMNFEEFPNYLLKNINMSEGIGLKPEHVPQTKYWLFVNNRPVGIGKLRHYLNDNLRKHGGHIGYTIRPSERGRGYGNIILKELLIEAKKKGIHEVLLTCDKENLRSRKVIEYNNGKLESIIDYVCSYWIRDF